MELFRIMMHIFYLVNTPHDIYITTLRIIISIPHPSSHFSSSMLVSLSHGNSPYHTSVRTNYSLHSSHCSDSASTARIKHGWRLWGRQFQCDVPYTTRSRTLLISTVYSTCYFVCSIYFPESYYLIAVHGFLCMHLFQCVPV